MTIEPGSIIEMTEAEIHALNKKIANDYDLLVKAAPDLLDALIDMVEAAKKSNGAKSFTELGAIGRASAAIAKATGEQYEN